MRKFNKSLCVLLSLIMVFSLFIIIPVQASDQTGQRVYYKYRFWDSDKLKEIVTYQDGVEPLSSCRNNHNLSGWYYLDKSFEVGDRVTVTGEAHIILTDGYTATFKKGIRVADGKKLNLYPNDKNDNGKLIANGYDYVAAIGSNDEDDDEEDKAGTINIYGGTIDANGGTDGAGIGGGNEAKGGTVNIYGGSVTAKGGNYAAGIGGGDESNGGTVVVYGGKVAAYGGQDGAGIGGGEDGSGADYTQYGGSVNANGGRADDLSSGGGAGIGGGECGSQGGTVNIHGGSLCAQHGSFGSGAGIGGGYDASGGTVNISGGTVYASGEWGAGIGGGIDHANGTVNITGGTVKAESEYGAGIGSGFGKNNRQGGDIVIENASVTAIGKSYSAGIGGGGHEDEGGSATKITIRNSAVYAGSSYGAGIGGAGVAYGDDDGGHGGDITIENSTVYAISKERGAGIGGGCSGDGGSVTIKDSYVEAYGGSASYDYIKDTASYKNLKKKPYLPKNVLSLYAAEYDAKVADVIVALILNNTWGGAGIGGGSNGRGANVTVTGNSTVITGGGDSGAVAIGHGRDNSENRTLTLGNNLNVQAGKDTDHLNKVSFDNRVSACQSNKFAVITPCSHTHATYRGVFEGHAIESCPDCGVTFDENNLEPHIFYHQTQCSVCNYDGVEIQFDSDGRGGHIDPVYITKGAEYTLPEKCAFSILYYDSKTYYLCGWKIDDVEYRLGETITVDHDITAVGVFARGNIDIINSQYGHVLADVAAAPPGASVTLTAVPDYDCRLTSIMVTAGADSFYEQNAENGNSLGLTHQFTMPDGYAGVTVKARFEKNKYKIQLDEESFASRGEDSPMVLVNDGESDTASLGDTITVAVSVDSSVAGIVWFPVDGDGNITNNSGFLSHCFIVGSDGKASFKMPASSDIKISAVDGHIHNGVSFSAWGSGAKEKTSLPTSAGNYYLTTDIILSEPWYLQSDVSICLNGHKIIPSKEMEYMIYVRAYQDLYIYDHDNTGMIDGDGKSALIKLSDYGTLTLYGGTLKNGFGGGAAGVYVGTDNTFTMHGGVITDMHVDWDSNYFIGAGVFVHDGKFIMDGGTITGNEGGSGVYVDYGKMELSGDPVINNNGNKYIHSGDVWLSSKKVINITGKLSRTACIGIKTSYTYTPDSPIVVTKGFSGNASLDNFYSTYPDMTLGIFNGELALAGKRTVSFDMNGGTPAREPESAALGCDYILPENTATKEKSVFTGWKIGDTDTVLPAGETIYISDDVTLHAVWSTADEYAYIEDHVHNWEIKIDEEDNSKVTVRCLNGDECNEGAEKYAQLQINGQIGTYETTYSGSAVTATVYKQPQKGFVTGFYDESLIHISDVFYTDVMGEVLDSAPVNAGVYFANATVSPATGKGKPATIRQMIVINKAQPNITVSGVELMQTGEPQKLVNATDISEGNIVYRINGGDWTLEPLASDNGEYEIEWYYVGENYANIHSYDSPGIVYSRITDEHIHNGITFETPWSSEADMFPTQSGNWYIDRDITLTEDVTIANNIKLCLNGKTIDLNGHSITVNSNASLELYAHDGGAIIGSDKNGSNIDVLSEGTLISHDVTFSGLCCEDSDKGAITVDGRFLMDGGNVTNSRSAHGGVYVRSNSFELTGSPVVKNNTDLDGTGLNVFLRDTGVIGQRCYTVSVKEGLSEDADIGIYAEVNTLYVEFDVYMDCTFTSGFKANCPNSEPSAIFSIDQPANEKHCIWLDDNGEAVIGFHKHSYETVSVSENSVQIRCVGKGDCITDGKVLTITLKAEDAAYDGNEHPAELITDIPDSLIKTDNTNLSYLMDKYRDSNNRIVDRLNPQTHSFEYCAPFMPGTYTAHAVFGYSDHRYELKTTYTIHEHLAGETVRENETASTCSVKGGYDEVTYCTVCGEEISRTHFEYELVPHTEEIISATPADCEHTGLTEGKRCSVCGTVLVEQEIIPVTPHTYGKPMWIWAEDYSTAIATLVCTVCGHEESAAATISDEFTGDSVVYTATAELLGKSYNDKRTISADAAASVTVNDVVTKYRTFDEALENWIDGSTLTLLSDVTHNGVITVNHTVTLDLNGHTLSRNLPVAIANGNVITNNGSLTIIDSSEDKNGTVTGGANTSAGGAILNIGTLRIEDGNFSGNKAQEGGAIANKAGATLIMDGGSIAGNTTTQWGGAGVLNQGTMMLNGGTISDNRITAVGMNGAGIWTNGTLTITGGTITGNSSQTGNGGGIYYTGGTLNLFGSPVITRNTALDADNDLYIKDDDRITIGGVISEDAKIGIRLNTMNSNAFTNGLQGNGDASNFISNDKKYVVSLNDNGEACFKRSYFVAHSLSLNGNIGVNFYLDLTEQEIADGTTVDFIWKVNGVNKTHSVTLTSEDKCDLGYKASCPIAVAEMTYDINATLIIGGEQIATDTYSAQQYANVILTDDDFRTSCIAKTGEDKYDRLIALVKTMLDYGSKAQVRFERNTDKLANGGNDFFTGEVTIPNMSSDMNEYLSDCGLEYVGSSVIYLTETTLRHYYKIVNASKFTEEIKNGISFDGEAVTYGTRSGMIYFDKKDVAASDLDTEYVLNINGHDYRYSALDYSALSYESDNRPYNESISKQLAASVYRYNQAANEFFD